jgi:G:T-mismatch repair DNA endonuclease (very short patch repair protein)
MRDEKGRFIKGIIPWNKGLKGIHLSPKTEFKKGEAPHWMKDKKKWKITREKISKAQKGIKIIPEEMRKRISLTLKNKFKNDEEFRKKYYESLKKRKIQPDIERQRRKKISNTQRKLWKNQEFKERVLRAIISGWSKRPTKPEQKLIKIIEKHNLPFKYTGDGSFLINGFIPDFIECNGKKLIIELFGDYWHNPNKNKKLEWYRTEEGRKNLFSNFGFKTLIIWESELKDEDSIVNKINEFIGGKENEKITSSS